MPSLHDSTEADAPPEEVWKLLYDPSRFPEWWAGIGSVEVGARADAFTLYPEGYPDYPMAQRIDTEQLGHRVTVSCLVDDLRFEWLLEPLGGGDRTRISVNVEIPAEQAARESSQREAVRRSLAKLAELVSV